MAIPKKTGEPFRKSTRSQVEIRRGAAFKLLINGYGRSDIIQYYAVQYQKTGNKLWNVGDRTVSNDIAALKKKMEDLAAIHREEELGGLVRVLTIYTGSPWPNTILKQPFPSKRLGLNSSG